MNTLATIRTVSPLAKNEDCAMFVIDDVSDPFTLNEVIAAGPEYTFSLWVKSDAEGMISIHGSDIPTTPAWAKHTITIVSESTDFTMVFDVAGVYYIYHPQLELGNVASDWSLSPADIEERIKEAADKLANAENRLELAETVIQQLSDCISMLVTDGEKGSLMTQTANGWTFDISNITKTLDSTANSVDALTVAFGDADRMVESLKRAVNDLGVLTDYVIISSHNGQPCIELGEAENDFRLRITNTEIQFVDGSSIPAYITNQKLMIEQAEVKDELQFGGFVWKIRSNGNMGLIWKGGSS